MPFDFKVMASLMFYFAPLKIRLGLKFWVSQGPLYSYKVSQFLQPNVYAQLCLIFWATNQGNSCRRVNIKWAI